MRPVWLHRYLKLIFEFGHHPKRIFIPVLIEICYPGRFFIKFYPYTREFAIFFPGQTCRPSLTTAFLFQALSIYSSLAGQKKHAGLLGEEDKLKEFKEFSSTPEETKKKSDKVLLDVPSAPLAPKGKGDPSS